MFNSGFGFDGFDFGFSLFQLMFSLMFLLVFGIFLVTIFQSLKQWNRNNHSPQLTVDATVVSKRQDFRHHHHNDNMNGYTSTSYYVTFEVESGDRLEFHVNGSDYGLLVEGDFGRLTFQGTRYLGFEKLNKEYMR